MKLLISLLSLLEGKGQQNVISLLYKLLEKCKQINDERQLNEETFTITLVQLFLIVSFALFFCQQN
jgi:hypothetical protein